LRVWRAIPARGIVIAEFPSFEAAKGRFEPSFTVFGDEVKGKRVLEESWP